MVGYASGEVELSTDTRKLCNLCMAADAVRPTRYLFLTDKVGRSGLGL